VGEEIGMATRKVAFSGTDDLAAVHLCRAGDHEGADEIADTICEKRGSGRRLVRAIHAL
jgi:hypothetical protein